MERYQLVEEPLWVETLLVPEDGQVVVGTVGIACNLVVFGSLLESGNPLALVAPSEMTASFHLCSTFVVDTLAGPFVGS